MMTERPDWNQYFLGVAEAVAARGECLRSRVGAVLVRDRRIVATGYNGVAPGMPSCLQGLCPRGLMPKTGAHLPYDVDGPGRCIATHAEDNVLRDCLRRDIDIRSGDTMYVTKEPCDACRALLHRHGVTAFWEI